MTERSIDRETGSNEIFAMFDKIESETQCDIENLLEDSDTEYIEEEPVLDNKEQSHQLLTREVTVHVEGEVWIKMNHQLKNLKRKLLN